MATCALGLRFRLSISGRILPPRGILCRPRTNWATRTCGFWTTFWAPTRSFHPEVPTFYYTHESYIHEPFTLMAYLAAITTNLELTTGIIILPQRQTALVAKQAAQVDVLSGGRVRLGIGVGWNPVEFEALNERLAVTRQAQRGADRGAAPVVDAGGRRLQGPVAPHRPRRHQAAADSAPHSHLDRRRRAGAVPCLSTWPCAASRGSPTAGSRCFR